MKKFTCSLLCVLLVFVLSACNSDKKANSANQTVYSSASTNNNSGSAVFDYKANSAANSTSNSQSSANSPTNSASSKNSSATSGGASGVNSQGDSNYDDPYYDSDSASGTSSNTPPDNWRPQYLDATPAINVKETNTSEWSLSNLKLSNNLENLSKLTTYDLLPTIESAAAVMKTATVTTDTMAKFVENTSQTQSAIAALRKETEKRIESILEHSNPKIPSNAKVYYVSNSGSDSNNGTSPKTPWASLAKAATVTASRNTPAYVLFERGGVWRGQLSTSGFVTYSSYGKGDKPKIYGSPFNGGGNANKDKWVKHSGNIWKFTSSRLKDDVGALIFNDSAYSYKKLSLSNVKSDLDFYHDYSEGVVYLYSSSNPATRFSSIEFNVGRNIILAKSYVTIDNLCIKYGGRHGVAANTCSYLTVKNCEFGWIGGSLQHPGTSTVRLGNAVEIWGYCDNYTVIDNYIYQIYDAGITQQITLESNSLRKQQNILYSGNVIENCNYSIEYWITSTDKNPSYIDTFLIEDNLMWYAGRGLCETRSDKGNACHIQGWRHYNRNRAKNYVVRNNVMVDSVEQLVNIYSTQKNNDGYGSMPLFNNNIMLNKTGGQFGVLKQGEAGNTSWPKTVSLNKQIFNYIDYVLNGDILGVISSSLYKNGKLNV